MRDRFRYLVALAASALLIGAIAGSAVAADLPLKPPPAKTAPAKPEGANDFDKLEANCIEATDGCRNYARTADGKFHATNNIGIACQPKPLTCSKRR